jgi:hypothetical protein
LFGRVENVKNDELFSDHDDPLHDVPFRVTKFQAGYACRVPITGPLNLALGGSIAAFNKPRALDARLWQETDRRDGLRPIEHRSLM